MPDRAARDTTVLVVRSGRSPHTICLAIGLVLISCYGLIFTTPSISLDSGLSPGQRLAFGLLAVAGSAITLLGIYRRNLRTGLQLERAGQVLLTGGAVTYVIALCIVSTFARSGLVTTIACAIGAGSLWRIAQITKDLRLLAAAGR